MIEIRMDRRQAFYAFVGCMLIVSVAFVVGLIVGQRMQLVELPDGPSLAIGSPGAAARGADARGGGPASGTDDEDDDVALLPVPEERAGAAEAPEDFTFYDALNRPRPEHEAARLRPLAREPEPAAQVAAAEVPEAAEGGVAAADRTPEPRAPRVEPVTPRAQVTPPAAATTAAPAPRAPRAEEVAIAPQPERDDDTRVVSRRVRRVGEQPSAGGVEEFGHFIVEAGRFDAYEAAAAARERIAAGGHSAIVSMVGEGPRPYRVEVGDAFTRRSEAESLANRVGGRVVSQR
jgi:hypothetical protein